MIYCTTGDGHTDIDAYASCLAYVDLLSQRNKPAKVFFPAKTNYSVPDSLRIFEMENYELVLSPNDKAIVLDVSVPEVVTKYFPESQILEIIDHHTGYEEYWKEHLGSKAIIEKIGAVATNIFDWWGECWDYGKMSPKIAKLLLAGILDNTLNFNASMSTERDKQASEKLAEIAGIKLMDFTKKYFEEVSKTVLDDLQNSIQNDTKPFHIPKLDLDIVCGQLTVWDGSAVMNQKSRIEQAMAELSDTWLCSVINISDKRNFILTNNTKIANYISEILGLKQENDWLVSSKLWLRKEIFAEMLKEQE